MGRMNASREPLNPQSLAVGDGWRVEMVAETGSTNADLLEAAAAGAAQGLVRVAEFQRGGRGRLERDWSSPAGAGLTFSLLLRPRVALPAWGWLPLLAGVALSEAVGAQARLKWPNDLLLGPDGLKAAGILVQTADGAAVVGAGLNVSTSQDELPVPTATSLALQGIDHLDRSALLAGFLNRFDERYSDWESARGDAEACGLAQAYRRACATVGSRVIVQQPSGELVGEATGVDADGRLLVRPDGRPGGGPGGGPDGGPELVAIAAGDVTHLRSISR